MTVMVIGSGGREHAIIKKIKENSSIKRIYCLSGNGGIGSDAECIPIKPMDFDGILAFAREHGVGFAIVSPDDPLVAGLADLLRANGIRTFGPGKDAAAIEGSKVFAKNLMQKYGIPTAKFRDFTDAEEALEYIKENACYPIVVKADGLALGKGVVIARSFGEAETAVNAIMRDRIFGDSGRGVVVEEFLEGPEVSVLAFTDSKTVKPMISSMDHKRAFDGDAGPNTGGMGAIAPNPFYTEEAARQCMERIFIPTIEAMNREGRPFKGCLYFGLMLTGDGPKVIEYNCRFGDPETQVVLPLLKTDLFEIMSAVCDQRLAELEIKWSSEKAACVVMASGGYPGEYKTGYAINGLKADGQAEGVTVYHAGTRLENGVFKTAGGRVLGVTAAAKSLASALQKAYTAIEGITFNNAHYRKDIGKRGEK